MHSQYADNISAHRKSCAPVYLYYSYRKLTCQQPSLLFSLNKENTMQYIAELDYRQLSCQREGRRVNRCCQTIRKPCSFYSAKLPEGVNKEPAGTDQPAFLYIPV